MRAQRDAIELGERMIGPQRFKRENVQAGASDMAFVQGVGQRLLVYQRSARRIDADGAAFQHGRNRENLWSLRSG